MDYDLFSQAGPVSWPIVVLLFAFCARELSPTPALLPELAQIAKLTCTAAESLSARWPKAGLAARVAGPHSNQMLPPRVSILVVPICRDEPPDAVVAPRAVLELARAGLKLADFILCEEIKPAVSCIVALLGLR